MRKKHQLSTTSDTKPPLQTNSLLQYAEDWFLDSEIRQLSPNTIASRKIYTQKLDWFLKQNNLQECGTKEFRQFIHYLSVLPNEDGRWGNKAITAKMKASTVATYHCHLRAFFSWLVKEGVIDDSPAEVVPSPINREDQVQPFTQEQIRSLLSAAKKSNNPWRDKAIILFLLDTGARASEVCSLNRNEVDFQNRRCTVIGKGNKRREIYFSDITHQALMTYLRRRKDEEEPLFLSEKKNALTRNGLLQLIRRLGRAAGIEAVRCSPHTFRHTYAIEFLRSGGNTFTLQRMLGHTSLSMTNKYVSLAQADMENQHRKNSPVMRLMKK